MFNCKSLNDNRIPLWDNIKFFLITLVVIGHVLGIYTKNNETCRSIFLFIYMFHMPFFIFISGLFFSKKNIAQKILLYIIFAYATKIIIFIFTNISHDEWGGVKFFVLKEGGIPWFLFSLAFFYLLTYLFINVNPICLAIFFIVLACFSGFDKSIGDFLCLSRTIVFYPFFCLGVFISKKSYIYKIKSYLVLKYICASFILVCFIVCLLYIKDIYFLRAFVTGRHPYSKSLYDVGPLIRLMCYIISALFIFSFIVIIPNKIIPFVTKSGMRTLYVYFWHKPIILLFYKFGIINDYIYSNLYVFILCLLSVFISCFLSFGLFEFPLKQIRKIFLVSKS